jgi:hypothetical protein
MFARLTATALLAVGPLPAGAGNGVSYAGTVSRIDGPRGTFVLHDVGPWRGDRETSVVNRTIVLTPSTTFAVASRVWEGARGFPGDYEESPARRSDLKEGAFVAVECQPAGPSCRALKLTLIETDPPS